MSGHSKWATTKRAKAAKDAKRSNLFTKLSKNITVAARDGGDPEMNFRLRMAIDKAKTYSMPRENIEKAIKRGAGVGGEGQIESLVYEVFAPGGVALILEILTDNKNRTVSNIKNILNKHNSSFGSTGSVAWMFNRRGQITLSKDNLSEDEEMKIIEAGAQDIVRDEDIKIITAFEELETVKNNLQALGFTITNSELVYIAKDKVKPGDDDKLLKLLDALDDDDDVNNIYTNAQI